MSTRRERQKEQRRERIFEAAIELFRLKGFDATTVEEIAEAADVAKGTFFNYFPSKEALLGELARGQVRRLTAAVRAEPQFTTLDTRSRIRLVYRALAAGIAGRPDMLRLVAVETALRQPVYDEHQQLVTDNLDYLLSEIMRDGQARGEVRTDLAPEPLGRHLRGFYFLAALEWLDTPGSDLVSLLDQALELAFSGISAPIV